jgi:NAD(P)-dependent dehydrogenase (short-subunit alcohol dehydrogenase family)
VLPIMRKQRSGCILQISSVGGRLGVPATRRTMPWAVGGFTEALAKEVGSFGVNVCALEPGGTRTNWGSRAHQHVPELLPDYESSVGAVIKALGSLWGRENSDPAKVAQVILGLPANDSLPAHLLIGSDAIEFAAQAEALRTADAERWREVSASTDIGTTSPLPALRF